MDGVRSQKSPYGAIVDDRSELLGRINSLEKSRRRLTLGLLACISAIVAACLMGQAPLEGRTVEAEKMVLYDRSGRIRAVLDASGTEPSLTLKDENGR